MILFCVDNIDIISSRYKYSYALALFSVKYLSKRRSVSITIGNILIWPYGTTIIYNLQLQWPIGTYVYCMFNFTDFVYCIINYN